MTKGLCLAAREKRTAAPSNTAIHGGITANVAATLNSRKYPIHHPKGGSENKVGSTQKKKAPGTRTVRPTQTATSIAIRFVGIVGGGERSTSQIEISSYLAAR